jgi:5'-3' exonuclease
MTNTKKPFLLIDSSYVSFHRFFSTLIWYNNIYQKEEENDYDWSENQIFMKYFNETYMKSLLKFKAIYNVPFNQMIIVRDCPRETIWRMSIYPEYKATRKNTCSYKNKKYNIGNIFKHIYNKLYPIDCIFFIIYFIIIKIIFYYN